MSVAAALYACSSSDAESIPSSPLPAPAPVAEDAGAIAADAADPTPPDASTPPPCAPAPSTYTKTADVPYAKADLAQKLDLYVPDGPGPYPLVVWVHGGGWQSGDKAPTQAMREATRGYVVASVNYRLSDTAKFPAQIHDVKAALRFLRANAPAYKIDPTRVGAWGPSAGGHLVALLGTSGNVAALEDLSMGNPDASSTVQAVVDFFGPTDFSTMSKTHLATCPPSEHDQPTSGASKLVGCALPTCPDKVQQANPIAYVGPNDPPFLIMHGTADCTVPPNQSQLLFDALKKANVSAKLEYLEGAEHADAQFKSPKVTAAVEQFLDTRLKKCP